MNKKGPRWFVANVDSKQQGPRSATPGPFEEVPDVRSLCGILSLSGSLGTRPEAPQLKERPPSSASDEGGGLGASLVDRQ